MKLPNTTALNPYARDLLSDVCRLDSEMFGADDGLPEQTCRAWLDKDPRCVQVMLSRDGRLCGYFLFLFIQPSAWRQLYSGQKRIIDLTQEDLAGPVESLRHTDAYLGSIVSKTPNSFAAGRLVLGMLHRLSINLRDGVLRRVVLQPVSKEGRQLYRRLLAISSRATQKRVRNRKYYQLTLTSRRAVASSAPRGLARLLHSNTQRIMEDRSPRRAGSIICGRFRSDPLWGVELYFKTCSDSHYSAPSTSDARPSLAWKKTIAQIFARSDLSLAAPSVISLGCGDATFDQLILPGRVRGRPTNYVGVDYSATSLDVAAKVLCSSQFNWNLVISDITSASCYPLIERAVENLESPRLWILTGGVTANLDMRRLFMRLKAAARPGDVVALDFRVLDLDTEEILRKRFAGILLYERERFREAFGKCGVQLVEPLRVSHDNHGIGRWLKTRLVAGMAIDTTHRVKRKRYVVFSIAAFAESWLVDFVKRFGFRLIASKTMIAGSTRTAVMGFVKS
jgi:hypothetical protein